MCRLLVVANGSVGVHLRTCVGLCGTFCLAPGGVCRNSSTQRSCFMIYEHRYWLLLPDVLCVFYVWVHVCVCVCVCVQSLLCIRITLTTWRLIHT